MPLADFNTNIAKLIDAVETLEEKWAEAQTEWHDENSRNFEENHLRPIVPNVKQAIDAMNRLSDVLTRAQRECEDPG